MCVLVMFIQTYLEELDPTPRLTGVALIMGNINSVISKLKCESSSKLTATLKAVK